MMQSVQAQFIGLRMAHDEYGSFSPESRRFCVPASSCLNPKPQTLNPNPKSFEFTWTPRPGWREASAMGLDTIDYHSFATFHLHLLLHLTLLHKVLQQTRFCNKGTPRFKIPVNPEPSEPSFVALARRGSLRPQATRRATQSSSSESSASPLESDRISVKH